MINPEQKDAPPLPEGFVSFSELNVAQQALPHAKTLNGTVHNLSEFLQNPQETLIDFHDLGVLAYTFQKNIPKTESLSDHLLPPWLDYVRSNELWGPQGKWTRFHQRMISLFEKSQLLQKASVGIYSLRPEAEKLEKFGVTGSKSPGSYDLHLSWTFSLSDLEKIETIVLREFECIS